MDYVKNPIIAGLLTAGISYIVLRYKYSKDNTDEDNKNLKHELFEKTKYPIILGLLVFIGLTIINTDYNTTTKQVSKPIQKQIIRNPMTINSIGDALPTMPKLTSIVS